MDIETKITKIMWGKSIVEVKDYIGDSHTFILRSLSISETNNVDFIYDKIYQDAVHQGILTYEQLKAAYEQSGVWGDVEEDEIKDCHKEIKKLKHSIANNQFMTVRKRQLEKKLEKVKNKLNDLNQTKSDLFSVTAEQRAEEVKRRFVVMMSVQNYDETPYWHSKEDFLNETDSLLVFNLAYAYYRNNIFSEQEIREIARSPQWQFRYRASKTGADLFGKPIAEWSEMQNLLVYWSQIYDSAFNAHERPADHIIEDDNAFDSWISEQNTKSKSGTATKKSGATQKKQHSEHFIMVQPGDKEAIDRVQSMNDPATRMKLRREYEQAKSAGRISEFDLRKNEIIREARKQ